MTALVAKLLKLVEGHGNSALSLTPFGREYSAPDDRGVNLALVFVYVCLCPRQAHRCG